MKTAAKVLFLAAVVALFAFIGITYGVPVEKNDSIVYFGTNVFLLDNTNTPLHIRLQGFAAQDYWTNGIAVSATNTAEEIVELFVQREGWQGKIGIYDPTNGIYRLYPHDGIVKGSYTTNPPISLWDGRYGNWIGGYSNATKTVYASNLVLTGDGLAVLGRDVKSKLATSVGICGASFGNNTIAGDYGAVFGLINTAGDYGAAFGRNTISGESGAAFGRRAIGASGSFVFADNYNVYFDRTNYPNSFNVRASGGTYFATPELVVTGAVTATKFYLRTNNSAWLQSDGTNLFFISTVSPGFTNALTTNTP